MEPHSFLVNGVAGGTVTAAAGTVTEVRVTVNLYRVQLDKLLEDFPHGTYAEGFVSLVPDDGTPVLGIPFLGFWGDWGAAPVMEPYDAYTQERITGAFPYLAGNRLSATRDETEYERRLTAGGTMELETLGAFGDSASGVALGYDSRFNAISPNGDRVMDYCAPTLMLLRAASSGFYTVRDGTGRVVWTSPDIGERYKFYSEQLADDHRLRWHGEDQNGRRLPDGQYTINVNVTGMASWRVETWSVPVYIDTQKPAIGRIAYDGSKGILSVDASDNHYVKSVSITARGGDGKVFTYDTQEFYRGDTSRVTAEFCLPGLLLREPQTKAVSIIAADFAGNETAMSWDISRYNVPVADMRGGAVTVSSSVNLLSRGIQEHGALYLICTGEDGKTAVHFEQSVLRSLADWSAGARIYSDGSVITLTAEQLQAVADHDFPGGVTVTLTMGHDTDRRQTARVSVSGGDVEIIGQALLAIPYTAYSHSSEIFAVHNGKPVMDSYHDRRDGLTIRAAIGQTYTIEASEAVFNDVLRFHKPRAIDFFAARGVMEGDGDGSFWPINTVTRAEFAKIMALTADADLSQYQRQNPFDDVRAVSWYAPYVAWAADVGLAKGTGNQIFNPHGRITFEEMAVFVARFAEYRGTELPEVNPHARFSDHDSIRSWARDEATSLLQAEILYADRNGSLNPRQPVLRYETAEILFNYIVYGIFSGY
jgi:hypothetical protein